MASVRSFLRSFPEGNHQFIPFGCLKTEKDINIFIDNLDKVKFYEVELHLSDPEKKLIKSFINDFQCKYLRLSSDSSRSDFRTAFKNHQKCICKIVEQTIAACEVNNSLIENYHEIHSKVIITIEGEMPIIAKVQPRSFKKLYEITRRLLTSANSANELLVNGRLITTIASLINDFRLSESESDTQVSNDIETMSNNPKLMSTVEFYNQLNSDVSDNNFVKEYIRTVDFVVNAAKSGASIKSFPRWSRSIIIALRRLKRIDYNSVKLKYSSSSSGTSYRTGRGTNKMPAFLASIYEKDSIKHEPLIEKFDKLVNFGLTYRSDSLTYNQKVRTKNRYSCAIDQKKPKKRIINVLNNADADRLTFFEHYDFVILNNLNEDCTMDQSKGPDFIKRTLKEDTNKSVYSLDLTDATNTMLVALQKEVKRRILSLIYDVDEVEILVDTWEYLMVQPITFKFFNKTVINYIMSSGQPMGYPDSFASFALTHHLGVLTVMRLRFDDINPNEFYRLLGDDLVIACYDPGFVIPDLYKSIMASANVECNTTKGYIYNPAYEQYNKPLAEFAKYLIMDGFDLTPIPIKLLTYVEISQVLGLLCWLQEHSTVRAKSGNYLLRFMGEIGVDRLSINYYKLLMSYNISNLLTKNFPFKKKVEPEHFTKYDAIMLLFIIKDNINLSVINSILKEGSIMRGIETFRLKGYKHVRDDINLLYSSGELRTTKLGVLLDTLEEIQLYSEVGLENLFADLPGSIEDVILQSLPIIKFLRDQCSLNKLLQILNLFQDLERIEYFSQSEIYELCQTIIQLTGVVTVNQDRSWVAYARRVSANNPTEILAKMSKQFGSYFNKHGEMSPSVIVDNLCHVLDNDVEIDSEVMSIIDKETPQAFEVNVSCDSEEFDLDQIFDSVGIQF